MSKLHLSIYEEVMKQSQESGPLILNEKPSDGHFGKLLNSLSVKIIIFIAVLHKPPIQKKKKKLLSSNSCKKNKNSGPLEEGSHPFSFLQHQEHVQAQTILEVFI